ncbi:asparagine synthase-related protein, partial [Streptomyces sp. DT18]
HDTAFGGAGTEHGYGDPYGFDLYGCRGGAAEHGRGRTHAPARGHGTSYAREHATSDDYTEDTIQPVGAQLLWGDPDPLWA